MIDYIALLRAADITLREIGDWRTRVRPGTFTPVGIMVHHTGDKGTGDSGLDVLVHGRPDLNGPLCNFSPRDDGTLALISAGRANHAGAGNRTALERVQRDLTPLGRAADLGLPDDYTGANGLYYGIEVDNRGDGTEPYPPDQYETVVRLCTALCRHHGWTANRVILHAEHTARKVDWNLAAAPLRAAVAARLGLPIPPPPANGDTDMFIVVDTSTDPHTQYLHNGRLRHLLPAESAQYHAGKPALPTFVWPHDAVVEALKSQGAA